MKTNLTDKKIFTIVIFIIGKKNIKYWVDK